MRTNVGLQKALTSAKESTLVYHLLLTFLKNYFGYFQLLWGQKSNLRMPADDPFSGVGPFNSKTYGDFH